MAESDEDQSILRASKLVGANLRGKYRLEAILGVGGMAAVYRATHRNGKQYAVKVLAPELSIRDDIRARFLREGRAANSIQHPGVVSVADDDVTEDGAAFLVMELLDGASLERIWSGHGRKLPLPAALTVTSQLLDVLAATHARGIIHRDIKPANLFITRDGSVKVLDFGIARVRDAASGAGTHATGTGAMLGTPAFMAPEQALANTEDIDARTDIWAVGATLFTLLAGEPVHEAKNPSQLVIRAATTPARPIRSLVADLPESVAMVIDRALGFERAERWPDAPAMRAAIEEASKAVFERPTSKSDLVALVAETEARPRAEMGFSETVEATSVPGASSDKNAKVGGDLYAVSTTAGPVSSAQRAVATPRAASGARAPTTTRRRIGAVIVACASVAAVAALVRGRGESPSPDVTRTTAPSVAAPPPDVAPPDALPTLVAPAEPEPTSSAAPAESRSANAVAPSVPRAAPSRSPSHTPKASAAPQPTATASAAPPPASSAPPAASAPACHAEKYIGEDGEVHFKKVCE